MSEIKRLHVIFKTHLDIGFTDLARNVMNKYFNLYIPKAIELAKDLRERGEQAQFIWTTGSWLIHEYLKQASVEQRTEMEKAIASGSIAWHGIPFTTHTELMDPALFEYGLTIAHKLNAQFGKNTISGKMTDVPGHTIGMVPLLAKYGVRYLHLGVNPASKVPNVPELFVWRNKDGSEVVVNYASNYGNLVTIEGFEEAMIFAHTGDNCGPPSVEDIQAEFKKLSEQFPGAIIQASTMDAFAEKLLALKDSFPVVHEEIGDTWIHGAATDPKKISQYRELLRLRDQWVNAGRLDPESLEYANFCDQMLLIPEHTWGLDEKKFLTDFKHYSIGDFHAARLANMVTGDAVPDKYAYIGAFAMNEFDQLSSELFSTSWEERSFQLFESSWQEQREYVQSAVHCLSEDKQQEAFAAFKLLEPAAEDLRDSWKIHVDTLYEFGAFQVMFAYDGSISQLTDQCGKTWADEDHRIGQYAYESFSMNNYENWFESYVTNKRETYRWADSDFGKPGMEFAEPKPEQLTFTPQLKHISAKWETDYDLVFIQLAMPDKCILTYGAPKEIHIKYRFDKHAAKVDIELSWFDKQANRLPEASWFSIALNVDNPNLWKMDKLGSMVSPLEVVKNGNRNLHALLTGMHYQGSDGSASIESLDAPIVSLGEKRLLQFDQTFASLDGGMHVNLHNNVWGTNFPMWYEEDARFRFSIRMN